MSSSAPHQNFFIFGINIALMQYQLNNYCSKVNFLVNSLLVNIRFNWLLPRPVDYQSSIGR